MIVVLDCHSVFVQGAVGIIAFVGVEVPWLAYVVCAEDELLRAMAPRIPTLRSREERLARIAAYYAAQAGSGGGGGGGGGVPSPAPAPAAGGKKKKGGKKK